MAGLKNFWTEDGRSPAILSHKVDGGWIVAHDEDDGIYMDYQNDAGDTVQLSVTGRTPQGVLATTAFDGLPAEDGTYGPSWRTNYDTKNATEASWSRQMTPVDDPTASFVANVWHALCSAYPELYGPLQENHIAPTVKDDTLGVSVDGNEQRVHLRRGDPSAILESVAKLASNASVSLQAIEPALVKGTGGQTVIQNRSGAVYSLDLGTGYVEDGVPTDLAPNARPSMSAREILKAGLVPLSDPAAAAEVARAMGSMPIDPIRYADWANDAYDEAWPDEAIAREAGATKLGVPDEALRDRLPDDVRDAVMPDEADDAGIGMEMSEGPGYDDEGIRDLASLVGVVNELPQLPGGYEYTAPSDDAVISIRRSDVEKALRQRNGSVPPAVLDLVCDIIRSNVGPKFVEDNIAHLVAAADDMRQIPTLGVAGSATAKYQRHAGGAGMQMPSRAYA